MACMETDYSKHTMEDKMAAGAFGRARNYGGDGPFTSNLCLKRLANKRNVLVKETCLNKALLDVCSLSKSRQAETCEQRLGCTPFLCMSIPRHRSEEGQTDP